MKISSHKQTETRRHFFNILWNSYKSRVPEASLLKQSLEKNSEVWTEDHVAFRSSSLKGFLSLEQFVQVFEKLAYKKEEELYFEEKKLKAVWLSPPKEEEKDLFRSPKVFVSEIEHDKFPQGLSKSLEGDEDLGPKVDKLLASDEKLAENLLELLGSSIRSKVKFSTYKKLRQESEYAAWIYLFGNQVNHFTLSVHLMKNFDSLKSFYHFASSELRVEFNQPEGKLIQGSPELLLEQMSTKAALEDYEFSDEGTKKVPYAFIEFIYRYPSSSGDRANLKWLDYYQGFRVANADKIFESTKPSI